MSKKKHRNGGKYCTSHTTIIPMAGKITDAIHDELEITKIQLGLIKAGLKPINGEKRVKISIKGYAISLAIRDNTTWQEIFVYSTNNQKTMESIARKSRNLGFHIAFGDRC